MRRSKLAVPWTCAVAAVAVLISCVGPDLVSAAPEQEPILLVARALLVDDSDASREWVGAELDCHACELVTTVSPNGVVLTYAVNRKNAATIARGDIEFVRLKEREGSFFVIVDLSELAEQEILKRSSPSAQSASFVDGQFAGVSPMRVYESTYLVGVYPDRAEAEAVARKLGWLRR